MLYGWCISNFEFLYGWCILNFKTVDTLRLSQEIHMAVWELKSIIAKHTNSSPLCISHDQVKQSHRKHGWRIRLAHDI